MERPTSPTSRSQDSAESSANVKHDPLAESRVRHKLDRNLIPLFFVLYLLAYLDRSNIGNARTAGMEDDLDLSSSDYSWLLTTLYIAYIIFESALLLWKLFPPHIVGASAVLLWGLFSTAQAGVQRWTGLMALRFLLGAAEAAYAPGIVYLLSFFYLRHEIGYRIGLFSSASSLASTFSGALAYGITRGHPSLASWRLLFLVEGIPSILMVPVAFFFIPDSPDQARFLTTAEKEIAKSRAMRQTGTAGPQRIGSLNVNEFRKVLLDLKAWLTAFMYFGCNVSHASLPLFLPTILRDMGFTAINAQGLSAPPYFLGFLLSILTTYIADKTQQRGLMLIVTGIVGAVGFVVLATVESVGVRYFAIYLAIAGVFPTLPNIQAWVLNNQRTDTSRGAALVVITTVGQCGPLLGTRIFESVDAPRYVKGMSVCAAFMLFTTIAAFVLRCVLVWENRTLNKTFGRIEVKEGEGEAREEYGEKFRYVL